MGGVRESGMWRMGVRIGMPRGLTGDGSTRQMIRGWEWGVGVWDKGMERAGSSGVRGQLRRKVDEHKKCEGDEVSGEQIDGKALAKRIFEDK